MEYIHGRGFSGGIGLPCEKWFLVRHVGGGAVHYREITPEEWDSVELPITRAYDQAAVAIVVGGVRFEAHVQPATFIDFRTCAPVAECPAKVGAWALAAWAEYQKQRKVEESALDAKTAVARARREARLDMARKGPWAAWVTHDYPDVEGVDPEPRPGWSVAVSGGRRRGELRYLEVSRWVASGGTPPWKCHMSEEM